jgi:prepilin-type N-terminal cleavage/methylation domain-containing protein
VGRKKILIIDDDETILRVLEISLSDTDLEVVTAVSAEAAFGRLKKEKFDLVIIDYYLPKVSGGEICRLIRTNPELAQHKKVPILILSGKMETKEVMLTEARGFGADDFLAKPFEVKDLVGKIKHLIPGAGFTLIELIMVIIILAIIAAASLPKFVNLTSESQKKTDDGVIGALNIAVKTKYLQNIASGTEAASAWPSSCPFTLMEQSPPNSSFFYPPDNVRWRYVNADPNGAWYIHCPHYNATGGIWGDSGSATKGRFYVYKYQLGGSFDERLGAVWCLGDFGH